MNASVMISELSMSQISSISGHERSNRTILCTSGAGVWYKTIEAFIIFCDFFCKIFLGIHNESVYLRGLLEGCLQYAVSYI